MLIDAIGGQGIARAPTQESREQILRNTALSDPRAAAGVGALINMTLFLHYGAPDPQTGQNPNWQTFGYPGPDLGAAAGRQAAEDPRARRATRRPSRRTPASSARARAAASIAAVLAGARARRSSCSRPPATSTSPTSTQLELQAYQEMFWRGGPTPTADGNVSLLAGHHPGRRHDDQLDELPAHTTRGSASSGRASTAWRASTARSTTATSTRSGADRRERPLQRPERPAAADAGGRRGARLELRDDRAQRRSRLLLARDTPATWASATSPAASRAPTGPGSRRAGARRRASSPARRRDARAHRGRPRDRRGGGLDSPRMDRGRSVTVKAPRGRRRLRLARVARAAAALGDRRSRGRPLPPAASLERRRRGLRRRTSRPGGDRRRPGSVDEFADTGEGYGFLIESGAVRARADRLGDPWVSGQRPQAADGGVPLRWDVHLADPRPRRRPGDVDANGEAVPTYSVTDPLDLENLKRGIEAQVRLHEAAGAHADRAAGRRGCRCGGGATTSRPSSPASRGSRSAPAATSSSAPTRWAPAAWAPIPRARSPGPCGELHDTKGVWIGDGSAFPTSSGTNPMITIMSLAHRTAEAIADDAGAKAADRRRRRRHPLEQDFYERSTTWLLRQRPQRRRSTRPTRSSATASTSAASGSSRPARTPSR